MRSRLGKEQKEKKKRNLRTRKTSMQRKRYAEVCKEISKKDDKYVGKGEKEISLNR